MRLNLSLGIGASRPSFSPLSLFAANEPGAWYDPSDFSTLFQDTAGTVPVTAAGQNVGLVLDKSSRLALGSDVRNLGTVGLVGTATAATYNTTTGVGTVSRVDLSNQSFVTWSGNLTANAFYRLTIQNTGSTTLNIRSGAQGGTVILALAVGVTATCYIPASATGVMTFTAVNNGETASFTLSAMRLIAGNHAFQSSNSLRPLLQQDTGGRYFLLFDGSDDFLQTNTITPGTDKAQVFAGVRKLSDAAAGMLTELSVSTATNSGSFAIRAPRTAEATYYAAAGGTLSQEVLSPASYPAPITNVLTVTSDIAGDLLRLRINGAQAASSTTDQGTGNFLTYPLFIGRRGGTSLPFNGRLYGLIVRFGANLTAAQITATETWMNGKTGAY